ncbi:murein hydrolase activator EnvC family protein [Lederbergia panacisoli]|uniref:murein hydrolase activator EnvC family protein n=1 Tax=Lederbergia panacisoli TaxID=1255251 RepID=UPI00214C72E1|nr:peptidoglycan DD-metalloendopeptidase family protein [Lederbergia panacisoli]MCR2822403.1 peptidoglycan DD-metalloendopeptidase family protein [Lederbergia panacisoli]
MKRRSVLSITLAVTLGFGGILTNVQGVSAANLKNLQDEQSDVINKRSNINDSIGEKDNQISEIGDRQSQLEAEMKQLENDIADTDKKITEKQKQIKETKAEIKKLKKEIAELKIRIEKRNELLKERARNIQQNGGSVKFIDVLLGAESFGDFIDRISVVSTLVNADKEIIEEQKADKEKLESNQKKVEIELASLNGMLKELENLKADLKNQNAKKAQLNKELAAEKKHLESEKMSLEEEAELLKAQEIALQKAIKLEKDRIAEEERKAREEAARIAEEERKAREAANANKGGATGPVNNNSGSNNVSKPPVSSGLFSRPANGYVSSGFGGRWGALHAGLDIAASGPVPIVAAASGVVSRSYTSSSYGNVVFVVHHLNGQTYETVYAHMRSRSVSTGQTVSKGQQLGVMGNTGHSYGQHLHFELHVGLWNMSKSNAVDPRRYINF